MKVVIPYDPKENVCRDAQRMLRRNLKKRTVANVDVIGDRSSVERVIVSFEDGQQLEIVTDDPYTFQVSLA